jgi:hypothetical protein
MSPATPNFAVPTLKTRIAHTFLLRGGPLPGAVLVR